MASVRAPWVLPIQSGTDLFGTITRTPAIVRITLGIKPGTPASEIKRLTEVSKDYIERLRPQLLSFYRGANMNAQLGVIPIAQRLIQFEAGMARYTTQPGGQEIIDITIYPDLAAEELKKPVMKWDYLELRFEWSVDDGGFSSNVEDNLQLPNQNTHRGLYTRAAIRLPKKIRDDALFVYARTFPGNGEQLYHPTSDSYFLDSDLRNNPSFYHLTWVGDGLAYAWGKNPDFKGAKHTQPDFTEFGVEWDGLFYLAYGGYFTGSVIGGKHYASYLVDLGAFNPNEKIDIELRSYWGGSFHLDPADGSPFPDVKLSYRLWAGGKVHWPQFEEEQFAPARGPIELADRRINTFTATFGGITYGPYTYQKLRGASTVGLGGLGGPADTTTYDESENRASDTSGLTPDACKVNTPGIYRSNTAGGAYSPSQIPPWPQPGMYYWYCPNGTTGGGVTEITNVNGVIKFTRSDGVSTQVFTFPQDFEMAIYSPQPDGTFAWNYGGTISPRDKIMFPKANDFFTHKGAELKGELCKGKQVEFYELPADSSLQNGNYDTPGVYFGNVTIDTASYSVTFSDKKGPDPALRGGPGDSNSEFYQLDLP